MGIPKKDNGIKLLVKRYTDYFDIDENINYYSFDDFLRARRKYVKCMLEGSCTLPDSPMNTTVINHDESVFMRQ